MPFIFLLTYFPLQYDEVGYRLDDLHSNIFYFWLSSSRGESGTSPCSEIAIQLIYGSNSAHKQCC
jgi:hypothetical protein